MTPQELKTIVEAAIFASSGPIKIDQIQKLFDDEEMPGKEAIRAVITRLMEDYEGRGIELTEVASGYRFQAVRDTTKWLSRMWEEKPPRYSRATLETLALMAYRQPITRSEIEDIRGVAVSSNIVKSLLEREWIRVVGHRDVPGKPALYATTKEFLDYFNLKSLDELPPLSEIKEIEDFDTEAANEGVELGEVDAIADLAAEIVGERSGDESVSPQSAEIDEIEESVTVDNVVDEARMVDELAHTVEDQTELVEEEFEDAVEEFSEAADIVDLDSVDVSHEQEQIAAEIDEIEAEVSNKETEAEPT